MDRGEVREADEVVKHLDTLRYKEKMVKEEIKKAEIEKAEIIQETEKAEAYKAKLETEIGKLDEIREQVRPLPFSVSQLFRNIGEAVRAGYNNLCAKIEHMELSFPLLSVKCARLEKACSPLRRSAENAWNGTGTSPFTSGKMAGFTSPPPLKI